MFKNSFLQFNLTSYCFLQMTWQCQVIGCPTFSENFHRFNTDPLELCLSKAHGSVKGMNDLAFFNVYTAVELHASESDAETLSKILANTMTDDRIRISTATQFMTLLLAN